MSKAEEIKESISKALDIKVRQGFNKVRHCPMISLTVYHVMERGIILPVWVKGGELLDGDFGEFVKSRRMS